ncbi:MAG: MotA/TolQ/ExbB proton channel family protein [Longimicrobiales bacterium]|nr:MotA/TolQ/ExbB proton channel family protein [Longimicrobiales bacterium]
MGMDLVELWGTMGWFAKGIVWLLAIMSLVSLTVAIMRMWDFTRSARATVRFSPVLSEAMTNMDIAAAEDAVHEYKHSHMAGAFRGIFQSLRFHLEDQSLTVVEVAASSRMLELNKLEQVARFRRGLGVLATVGSTAPFVGLLGTTMGVVNAFTGMAEMGSGGLAAISAGIAEALITTAFGLFVAIPAVWLFNYFQNKVEFVGMEIEYGSKEFLNLLLVLEQRLARGDKIAMAPRKPKAAEAATS